MDQVIRYRGSVSWQLFKRAQWTHLGARRLILLVFPVGMIAYAWFTAGTLSVAAWVLVVIISSAFVPFMLALNWLGWRRMYAKSPYLHEPLAGSVSPDKFIVEGATGRTEMAWDGFVRIREGKDALLLYQGPNLFHILAREFFESDAAWGTARRIATRASAR